MEFCGKNTLIKGGREMEDKELRLLAYREAWNVVNGIYQAEIQIWEGEENKRIDAPTANEVLVEAKRIYNFLIGG